MDKSELYRANAAECLIIASSMTDPNSRVSLLEMAWKWLRLAKQAEQNSRYKMPPRSDTPAAKKRSSSTGVLLTIVAVVIVAAAGWFVWSKYMAKPPYDPAATQAIFVQANSLAKRDVCRHPQQRFKMVVLNQFLLKLAETKIGNFPIVGCFPKNFLDPGGNYVWCDTM